MDKKTNKKNDIPNVKELENELTRVKKQRKFHGLLANTVYTLIVVASLAILVAVFFMPVLRIYGSSMEPTLIAGDIVVSVKTDDVKPGDIIAVYYGSKLLVKRVIAVEDQWINIDETGNIYINGQSEPLDEPYIKEKSAGELDIKFPYKVPVNTVFVLGDNRETSIDSRSGYVGSISKDEIVGKVLFRVWPLKRIKLLNR